MAQQQKKRKKRKSKKFPLYMKSKLVVFFGILLACLCALIGRIMYIEYHNGEEYKKLVLSKQDYDSKIIPYQRGDILDTNGTVLATSVAVYNIILDCKVLTSDEKYIEPTVTALLSCFPKKLKEEEIRKYIAEEQKRAYIILAKGLSYDEVQKFVKLQEEVDDKGKKKNPDINGVWFETEYKRSYPYKTLAADVIGFTSAGDVGTTGLEHYYDDVLNGINGREYGYLNSNSDYEKTVIAPEDGDSIVISIDENIQAIVEKKIAEFNEAYTNNKTKGPGAKNIAVVMQNPNTGEIIAMASYPTFDLSKPRDLSAYYTKKQIKKMSQEETYAALNEIWKNYCVTETYEPGSVQKPFTVACGLETGTVKQSDTFYCDGYEVFGPNKIHCFDRSGHGTETVEGALMDSCNDSLMQMSYQIGAEKFLEYQSIFGFGQKTGIDLPGEAYTASLIYTLDKIKPVDLATNSFGQNYNCTMVQMISAFSSLINGGTYYQPHMLKKIVDAKGNTVSTYSPVALKQTVSSSTSALIREYLYHTVTSGTATSAKVDGYSLGGKTGTAQKYPRAEKNYLVSFMGFAPYENPQFVIYCVIDTPNVEDQAHSSYALNLTREILKEVYPYMNIYPDEEKTGVNEGKDITGAVGHDDAQLQDENGDGSIQDNQIPEETPGQENRQNGQDSQGEQDEQDEQDDPDNPE